MRLCWPETPLCRRPRRGTSLSCGDRGCRFAGRRAQAHFRRLAAVCGQDRRIGIRILESTRVIACNIGHLQLFVQGYPRISRDLRFLDCVASLPAAAKEPQALLHPDERGVRRAKVRSPTRPRCRHLPGRMVAAQRGQYRRQRGPPGGGELPGSGSGARRRDEAAIARVHRIRWLRSGSRSGSRSLFAEERLLGHGTRRCSSMSVPVLSQAWSGSTTRRRDRTRQRRMA